MGPLNPILPGVRPYQGGGPNEVVPCRVDQGTPAEFGYSLLLIGKTVRAELAEKCRFYLPIIQAEEFQ
jgi:hypothetical protein